MTSLLVLAALAGAQALPPDSAYVQANRQGHLMADGKRVRLWGIIGNFPYGPGFQPQDTAAQRAEKLERSRRSSRALVQRFGDLGFNMTRLWSLWDAQGDYTPGDGSAADTVDYFVAELKKAGFRIWAPSIAWVDATPADVNLVNDPKTAAAWTEAMQTKEPKAPLWIARVWDERMEAKQRQAMIARATRLNKHTGLRLCDDPAIAIWELTNEEWWIGKMVGGLWRGLPDYFQASLRRKWTDYLQKKYGTEARLRARWGYLLPGESLARGTIAILPLASKQNLDASTLDPQGRRQLEQAFGNANPELTRDDLPRRRGEDVMEFFSNLQIAHKKRLAAALKPLGKSTRLSVTIFDTGIGYEAQAQYMHQQADAVSHNAYINGVSKPGDARYPWYSGLEQYPRICGDVPWLEHNKVEGKPFLCYETQIMQPAKYRAEYPLRLLALASIQDWDAVTWHYWSDGLDVGNKPNPFTKPMDVTTGWHPQGYHFTYDEVQNAMMRAAAMAFRGEAFSPAPNPTKFTFGRRTLYDPASMDYGASYGRLGLNMLPTTYRYGVRIWIDPKQEEDKVEGPMEPWQHEFRSPVTQPTPQIRFDIRPGTLVMDSPEAAIFTGFLARAGKSWTFANGVRLEDVSISVPSAMPYPEGIAEEKYIGFACVSEDGAPLAVARRVMLSIVSTSFNSGFRLAEGDKPAVGGELPVLVARVAAMVRAPALAGMRYTLRDWNMNVLGTGMIGPDGAFRVSAERPIWVVELSR